jgi:hypothetical protein
VTWQSIGCEGIGLADRGRRPRCSTSNDVAERRAVADRGRPRRSTLGDVAKRTVRGHWQTRGGILDAQRQVTWRRGGREQTGGGVLDARRRVTWQSGG